MTEELIAKYLQGQLTPTEQQQLNAWLEEDEVNRKVFDNMISDWYLGTGEVEGARNRVYARITGAQREKRRVTLHYWLKVAAVLTLAITASVVILNPWDTGVDQTAQNEVPSLEKVTSKGQKARFQLPDGTFVVMNASSKLTYPAEFARDQRAVYLEGEAFFDVKRDTLKPFRIQTRQLNVRVLGTSFNVRSYAEDDDVSVAVVSGKVAVSNETSPTKHVLKADEMLAYTIEKNTFSKSISFDHDLLLGWKDQYLVFKDEPLAEVLASVERWFDVEFRVEATVDTEKGFTAKFKNPTLKQVLESISYNYRFAYEIDEKEVIIQ